MQLDTEFEDLPGDEEYLYTIEHWSSGDINDSDGMHTDTEVEAFVHPRTATAARILASDDTYSVQPSMGDYGEGDCVVQPSEPGSFVSGGASVVMTELETLSEARAIAYAWMRGWVMRNSNAHGGDGAVLDANRHRSADPIP